MTLKLDSELNATTIQAELRQAGIGVGTLDDCRIKPDATNPGLIPVLHRMELEDHIDRQRHLPVRFVDEIQCIPITCDFLFGAISGGSRLQYEGGDSGQGSGDALQAVG